MNRKVNVQMRIGHLKVGALVDSSKTEEESLVKELYNIYLDATKATDEFVYYSVTRVLI